MARENAPNLRFAKTCLNCEFSTVTTFINADPYEYKCEKHGFSAKFSSDLVCDDLVDEHDA